MNITQRTTAAEFQQAHADAVNTIERYDEVDARHSAFPTYHEARLAGRLEEVIEAYEAFNQERKAIRQEQWERMNRVQGNARHASTADALAFLAMIPSPPEAWRGRAFRESQPVDHPGLWNKTHWEQLGFRPADDVKPFAHQDYRHMRKRFTATCKLYDVSAVVPIKRRPRAAE